MAAAFDHALTRFLEETNNIVAVHDLATKWRLELHDGYLLDLFYNETLSKYGYALILAGQRIIGWDNAPHHSEHSNFPHHVHYEDGRIEASEMTGDPEHDLIVVSRVVNALF